jgi:hypothetical protein
MVNDQTKTGVFTSSSERRQKTLHPAVNKTPSFREMPGIRERAVSLNAPRDECTAACCRFRKLARAIKYSGPMAFLMTPAMFIGFGSCTRTLAQSMPTRANTWAGVSGADGAGPKLAAGADNMKKVLPIKRGASSGPYRSQRLV